MATVESPPKPMEFESPPENWSDEWNYVVERQNGDEEYDRALGERADRVNELLNEPLSKEVVRDIDDLISVRWQQHEDEDSPVSPESSFLDKEISKISKEILVEEGSGKEQRDEESRYIQLINDLKGTNEDGRAKSLNEVWEETEQLRGAQKAKQLRALRVVSLAMNKVQPSHETEDEWAELEEEEKVLVRVAEINKLRVDVEVADVVYSSKKIAEEKKVQHAQELGEVLGDYASGDDIPESVQVRLEEAVAQAEGVVSSQKEKEDESATGSTEVALTSTKESDVNREGQQTVKPVVDRERLKRKDVPLIEKQLREHLKNKEHFRAAQLMAKMKRAGVVFKEKEGDDREERIKKYLVDGFEKVAKNSEEDGGVSAARYLSYLKYTGALDGDSVTDEKKAAMVQGVRGAFEKAASEKKSDVDWSLYAMHAKYVGAIDEVNQEQRGVLEAQTNRILNAGGSVDQVVTNEARFRYVDGDGDAIIPAEQVQRSLEKHKDDGDYGAYARLATAYQYCGDKGVQLDDEVGLRWGLRKYLDAKRGEAVERGNWNGYLVDIANVARVVRERGGVDHVSQAVDEVDIKKKAPGGEFEQDETSVLDGGGSEVEKSMSDTVVASETKIGREGLVEERSSESSGDTEARKVIYTEVVEGDGEGVEDIPESVVVDEDDVFPERAQFNRAFERHREMQRDNIVDKSVANLNEDELGVREQDIRDRKQMRREVGSSEGEQWAQAVVDAGIDLTDEEKEGLSRSEAIVEREKRVQWVNVALENRVYRAEAAEPDKVEALDEYNEMWLNELGRHDTIKKNDRISRFTEWVAARYRLGNVKKRIKSRQAYIDMLRDEALDEQGMDEAKRSILRALADEFEELNIKERKGSLKAKENEKLKGKKKKKKMAQDKEAHDVIVAGALAESEVVIKEKKRRKEVSEAERVDKKKKKKKKKDKKKKNRKKKAG